MSLRQRNNDTISIFMDIQQCRMARAALKWSFEDLAEASGVSRITIARFESGKSVSATSVDAMRKAMEAKRVKFIDEGPWKGAVYGGLRKAP